MAANKQLQTYRLLDEKIIHHRYLTLYDRTVQFSPDSAPVSFDVVGHPRSNFMFTVVFPFHPSPNGSGGEVTVVREYGQGLNEMVYALPTGGFDPSNHHTLEGCARAELSEEGLLKGGTWVRLLPETHAGLAEVKWCKNRFVPFLVIDPEDDPHPASRDQEEELLEHFRVTIAELKELMVGGDMMLPSVTTCFMALDELRKRGFDV